MAKEHGVVLLSLPPHCSHKLQPPDRHYQNNALLGSYSTRKKCPNAGLVLDFFTLSLTAAGFVDQHAGQQINEHCP
ncbi:hypothetical protein OUZ56_003316 [Daphnia magna]|uniref:DDE-1 domain-containing protein n=1 Tax=Daphnia magna TaxID=35525 RepID=A0ABR0A8S4_9CRUS|nr:hypothetical protein OUZ56_003316 [Daphnia magna]